MNTSKSPLRRTYSSRSPMRSTTPSRTPKMTPRQDGATTPTRFGFGALGPPIIKNQRYETSSPMNVNN